MPLGGEPYLPFVEPEQPEPLALPPPVVAPEVALPPPVDVQQGIVPPLPASSPLAQLPGAPALPPPVAQAAPAATALPPPVPAAETAQPRIGRREYLRELPLEGIESSVALEPIKAPEDATQEQKAAIDALNAERQGVEDAVRKAEIEQGLRTATAAANATLAADYQRERLAQLEAQQVKRAQQMKRREEVEAGVDQDYEQLRRLAKEKLPPMGTSDKIALVAVAAAGALNAALNGVPPGAATNTALQQIVNRRAEERAREITGLQDATAAGEAQLGMLDTAQQRTDYVNSLAKAELYEEVAMQADMMAAKATSNEERVKLAYAAREARANAAKEIAKQKQAQMEFQLKLSKEQREEAKAEQESRLAMQKVAQGWAELADKQRARDAEQAARDAAQQAKASEIGKERTIVTPVGDFQVRNPQVAAELTKKLTAGQEMIGLADKITTRRNSQGVEWTKSAEGQKMLADYGKLLLASKNFYELGALAGPDVEVIERVIGGDPNAIISMLPLLEATRENILTEMNLAISSNLVDPAERARFKPWQPPPPAPFTPSAEQATTTIRTGSVDAARGAAQEIVDAAKRENPKDWAEKAFRQLVTEKLALQAAREGTSGEERKALDQKINAVRKALDRPEAELGRKKAHEIGLDVQKSATMEREKITKLQTGLRGIMGVKRSEIGANPYMDALQLYRNNDDPEHRVAVMEAVKKAGYDAVEFRKRARGEQ